MQIEAFYSFLLTKVSSFFHHKFFTMFRNDAFQPLYITPPKTNMEPENEPLEEEIPIRNHHFQVPC